MVQFNTEIIVSVYIFKKLLSLVKCAKLLEKDRLSLAQFHLINVSFLCYIKNKVVLRWDRFNYLM